MMIFDLQNMMMYAVMSNHMIIMITKPKWLSIGALASRSSTAARVSGSLSTLLVVNDWPGHDDNDDDDDDDDNDGDDDDDDVDSKQNSAF